MPFAVHLELDPQSAAELGPITARIERIAPDALTPGRVKAGLHVSLAVYETLDPKPFAELLEGFAQDRRACAIKLSSLGLFPGPSSVVFVAPVVSAELLALHKDFHQLTASSNKECWPYYLPGNWVPHVTLGEGLNPGEAGEVVAGAARSWRPIAAMLHRVALIRFYPVEVLWQKRLVD